MSNRDPQKIGISGTSLVWAIAAMFIATVAAIVALAIGLPESQNAAGLGAQLLVSFAALVGVLGTLFKVDKISERVDKSGDAIDYLANGGGDAKTKAAIHQALDERDHHA